jgi:DinB superfamily
MKETIDQYRARILGYTEGKDALATQRNTPIRLARLTRGLSRAQLAKKSAPDTWSIGEILAHLSETEMVVGWRLRQALTNSGTPVHAYDQDDLARVGRYAKRDPRKSLALFTALRECNLSQGTLQRTVGLLPHASGARPGNRCPHGAHDRRP